MIFLGNLTIKEIEDRLNIILSEEDKKILSESKQEEAENIKKGKWHCFDLPFMIVCGDKQTAIKLNELFSSYDLNHAKQCCQLTWENKE